MLRHVYMHNNTCLAYPGPVMWQLLGIPWDLSLEYTSGWNMLWHYSILPMTVGNVDTTLVVLHIYPQLLYISQSQLQFLVTRVKVVQKSEIVEGSREVSL